MVLNVGFLSFQIQYKYVEVGNVKILRVAQGYLQMRDIADFILR